VKGLRARGGFVIDLTWSEGRLTEVVVRSALDSSCTLRYGPQVTELKVRSGQAIVLDGALKPKGS
jgi:alpha-L-fucosidase 2